MALATIRSQRRLRILVLVLALFATIGAWEALKVGARLVGVAHADLGEHVTCYEVHAKAPKDTQVLLFDQFTGSAGVTVKVGELKLLCTPAIKQRV